MTVSKLYSLPAERLDGKRRGYVIAVLKEGDGVAALLCADENEREFFVDSDKIVRAADRIIYRGEGARRGAGQVLRLNVPCFDERGKLIGRVEDYILKSYALKSCIINGRSYPAARVCLGDAAILKDRDDAPAAMAAKDMFLEAVMGGSSAAVSGHEL